MIERKSHVGLFAFEDQSGDEGEEEILIPENIEEINDEELQELEDKIVASFDDLHDNGEDTLDTVETLTQLADAVDVVRGEKTRRDTVRAEAAEAKANLTARIHAQEGEDEEGEETESEDEEEVVPETTDAVPEPEPVTQPEPVAVAAGGGTPKVPLTVAPRRINVPLSEVRRRSPQPAIPRESKVLTASDVPGFHAGQSLNSLMDLAKAIAERSRTTPVTASGNISGPKVATITREFQHKLSLDSSNEVVEAVLKAAANPDSLVAAGGWCAPSEIVYDFFNIADEDGMLDLPTIGISRGGVRFPTSPSLADVFSNIWLWTETDDIATITGGPNKPCFRSPCPSFAEERLECHGICVTAGNLTDEAYPELIANHISLTMSAHFHVMNLRHIADIVSQSVAVDATEGFQPSTTSSVLGAVELQVWDYRTKYGMADSAVLEAVFPSWIKGQMRSDLSKRTGVDLLAVSDADLMRWFDLRGVRVQFVQDWQVRASGLPGQSTALQDWPAAVSFLLYAAGTFVLGQGMVLDLGVVRDSVLNAENDYTAAWTEDCRLIAKIGHESRVVTVTTDNAGTTGAAIITGTGV